MKKIFVVICLVLLVVFVSGCDKNIDKEFVKESKEEGEIMEDFVREVYMTINDKAFTILLEDNDTSREFVKRLPLDISMKELNGNEKYYYFDKSLPSNSSKVGKINSGDVMLYGDDCLVLFYDTFNTSYSYTRIGKLEDSSNIKDVVGSGNVNVYISK